MVDVGASFWRSWSALECLYTVNNPVVHHNISRPLVKS
jgi:hypothetical protein